ncbi:NEDD8-activating protein UBA3 [Lachancea thermotolerans CBS 6340]|uniref:NEDD8-activating enzyme E1 catalytic subunit n=1 Tax=Lachancea thermotolerans (strain ATCC 56472 / CBS 6340 / NRRL Y-8284) TaxID=559295 RepID=C5DL79_LACTC|nr:KLTH0F10714p [Lachancea thermotolerans CBS 6340]CAR24230.1 KLTH0F10714p [Lachancea thermotolerans CBS 6340]
MADLADVSILVLGAGGLGCEILKNLAMQGIPDIHVVDMDTIELTNLNRQFLFRESDIGQSKALVAARFINEKNIMGLGGRPVVVTAHFQDLTLLDRKFIERFTLIVSGLDSIEARRFMNMQLVRITFESRFEKCIPFIDGGSEGLKGHCKTIIPGFSACYECSLDTLPAKIESYPLCTVSNNPRLPEHVIEFLMSVQWAQQHPDRDFDFDSKEDLQWLMDEAHARARQFNIDTSKLTPQFVLGVIKNIVPSVASTNAIIAAQCCTEVSKLLYNEYDIGEAPNFLVYNGDDGCFAYSFVHERVSTCLVCRESIQ